MADDLDRDEILESFRLILRMVADLRLEIEAMKSALHARGVSEDELHEIRADLKRRWDASGDALVQQIKRQRTVADLRRMLELFEGPKQ